MHEAEKVQVSDTTMMSGVNEALQTNFKQLNTTNKNGHF
jgi:hypothetical protein